LKAHIETVHEKKKKFFKCEICEKNFSDKSNLNKHISSVHEDKKPFKCELCEFSSSLKGNLNNHIKSVHQKKKTFNSEMTMQLKK
jgi:KRAB domain-containing zinc finger protein